MKRILALALSLILALSLVACNNSGATSQPSASPSAPSTAAPASESATPSATTSGDTIKIGVLTDRSSAGAATVKWGETGAELAVKQINDAGGINGKKVELIYRDTASDSANVAQKSTELVAEGVVAILGPKSDGEAPTGAQWAETNKFPMVTPCTYNTRVTIENASKYMFSCGFNAWAIANMNADYAKSLGYKSAYFIGNDGGASGDSRDFFYRALGEGFANLGSSQVSANATEFSNIISSVVGKDPDVIIGAVAGPNFVSLINQGQQFGLWDQCDYLGWYTCDSTNTTSLAQAGNYPYGKVHGVDLWPFWMDNIPGNEQMVADYEAIGGEGVYPSDMGFTWYVGITAIAEALKATSDWSPEGVTKSLATVHFDTIYGKDLHFRDFDHVLNNAYYYVTAVEDTTGKWSIPIGEVIKVYMADDILPTKAEMQAYAQENGYTFRDLSLEQ
jgi:branched-chain amino acid transport system substrate-binding protein